MYKDQEIVTTAGQNNMMANQPSTRSNMEIQITELEQNVLSIKDLLEGLINKLRPVIVDKPVDVANKSPEPIMSLLSKNIAKINNDTYEIKIKLGVLITSIDL